MGVERVVYCPLGKLADVRVGLTRRTAATQMPSFDGERIPLLQISDMTVAGCLRLEQPRMIERTELVERFIVRPGDLVVANRGARLTAALVPEGVLAVAGSQLFMVKILSTRIAKEYLHWYLNLRRTQKYLNSLTRGSHVKSLSVGDFRSAFRIPVPEQRVQELLVALGDSGRRERSILERIVSLREAYLETISRNLLGSPEPSQDDDV